VKEEQGIQKDIDKSQGLIEVLVSDIVALTLEKDETVESLQITDGTLKSVENLISALGSVIERDVVDGRRFAQPSAERKKQFNELIEQRSLLQQVLSDLASEENRLNNDIDQRKRQKVSEEDKIRRMQTDLARARERVRVAEQMVDGVTRGRVVTMSREEQIRQSLL
jgi:chromosome segregation ATPase